MGAPSRRSKAPWPSRRRQESRSTAPRPARHPRQARAVHVDVSDGCERDPGDRRRRQSVGHVERNLDEGVALDDHVDRLTKRGGDAESDRPDCEQTDDEHRLREREREVVSPEFERHVERAGDSRTRRVRTAIGSASSTRAPVLCARIAKPTATEICAAMTAQTRRARLARGRRPLIPSFATAMLLPSTDWPSTATPTILRRSSGKRPSRCRSISLRSSDSRSSGSRSTAPRSTARRSGISGPAGSGPRHAAVQAHVEPAEGDREPLPPSGLAVASFAASRSTGTHARNGRRTIDQRLMSSGGGRMVREQHRGRTRDQRRTHRRAGTPEVVVADAAFGVCDIDRRSRIAATRPTRRATTSGFAHVRNCSVPDQLGTASSPVAGVPPVSEAPTPITYGSLPGEVTPLRPSLPAETTTVMPDAHAASTAADSGFA